MEIKYCFTENELRVKIDMLIALVFIAKMMDEASNKESNPRENINFAFDKTFKK